MLQGRGQPQPYLGLPSAGRWLVLLGWQPLCVARRSSGQGGVQRLAEPELPRWSDALRHLEPLCFHIGRPYPSRRGRASAHAARDRSHSRDVAREGCHPGSASTRGPAAFGHLPQEEPPSNSMMQTSCSGLTSGSTLLATLFRSRQGVLLIGQP